MGDESEFRVRLTGDASGIVDASREGADALKGVAGAAGGEAAPALDTLGQKAEEGGKAAGRAGMSHRALHLIFRQVGEASKGLEIGLMALSGVMMGSVTYGIYAVVTAVKMLVDHFAKQKEVALEAAKVTVEFWTDALKGNAEARKAASDFAEAMAKIIANVDILKQKESEEETVLKRVAEQRLKILDAERQAELSQAGGDKEEEARINARYGKRKTDVELQNEQAEIELKRKHLAEQAADAMAKERAARAAEKAKEAGAPGREEAAEAGLKLPELPKELAKLQAERMKPQELAALRAQVAADVAAGKPSLFDPNAIQKNMDREYRASELSKAEIAEQAYSAAQQEMEQRQADADQYKTGTEKLAKALEQATEAFNKAVETARGTGGEIGKAERAHGVNVDAASTIQGVEDKAEVERAGGTYNRASQTVLREVRAMAGTASGERMAPQDTAYFNNLLAAARAAGKETMMRAVIKELQDLHTDESKKWQDLVEAIKQLRAQRRDGFNQ